MNEKQQNEDNRALLIETILDYEDRVHCNIYGMKFCQLCGKKQEYATGAGALIANSCNPFRCKECRIGRGKELLDRWFNGSMLAAINSRRYVFCQFCGCKVHDIKAYETGVLGLCYFCPTCYESFLERSKNAAIPSKVWWRQCRRLYLSQLDTYDLRKMHDRNLKALDARRRNTLKLAINTQGVNA